MKSEECRREKVRWFNEVFIKFDHAVQVLHSQKKILLRLEVRMVELTLVRDNCGIVVYQI